jgi:hypothetical protein
VHHNKREIKIFTCSNGRLFRTFLPAILATKLPVPLSEAFSGMLRRLRPRITRSTAASASTSMPSPLTIPSIPVSPAENRGEEEEKVKEKSESKSKAKGKGKEKETAGNRKRKRSDDEAYRDIYSRSHCRKSGATGDAQYYVH